MKKIILLLLLVKFATASAQKIENLIVITTDGFRWQELFGGVDSAIASNKEFNQNDSAGIFKKYWSDDIKERRKKLLPFFWSEVASKGQLYGNRLTGNNVNVANRYRFSYPGYNEIFTGYPDTLVNSNDYKPNPNTTLTEFINRQPKFKNRVAAFGAWNAFTRILNEGRSGVPVVNSFDKPLPGTNPLLARMLEDSYRPFGDNECLDVFTHYQALEYLREKKPKFLYIGYGETDEWAHEGRYKDYLNAANQVDRWIADLWNYVQQDPVYKNKTALFITTDHGRGDKIKSEWTSHGEGIAGADEIWFAVMGPGIDAKGEVSSVAQFYQKQFAQTIASLLGLVFKCEHPVGEKINLKQ